MPSGAAVEERMLYRELCGARRRASADDVLDHLARQLDGAAARAPRAFLEGKIRRRALALLGPARPRRSARRRRRPALELRPAAAAEGGVPDAAECAALRREWQRYASTQLGPRNTARAARAKHIELFGARVEVLRGGCDSLGGRRGTVVGETARTLSLAEERAGTAATRALRLPKRGLVFAVHLGPDDRIVLAGDDLLDRDP